MLIIQDISQDDTYSIYAKELEPIFGINLDFTNHEIRMKFNKFMRTYDGHIQKLMETINSLVSDYTSSSRVKQTVMAYQKKRYSSHSDERPNKRQKLC